MKKNLLSIAMGLSEKEIKELARLKKNGGKKLLELRRERKKLATALAKIDMQLAEYGERGASAAPRKARRKKSGGRKPAKPAKAAKKRARKSGRRSAGLTEAVRNVVAKASKPVRASEVVDALPEAGFKVKDVAATRKRVSIILATQKSSFRQAGRGLYQAASE